MASEIIDTNPSQENPHTPEQVEHKTREKIHTLKEEVTEKPLHDLEKRIQQEIENQDKTRAFDVTKLPQTKEKKEDVEAVREQEVFYIGCIQDILLMDIPLEIVKDPIKLFSFDWKEKQPPKLFRELQEIYNQKNSPWYPLIFTEWSNAVDFIKKGNDTAKQLKSNPDLVKKALVENLDVATKPTETSSHPGLNSSPTSSEKKNNTTESWFDTSVSWIKNNPMLSAGLLIGGGLLISKAWNWAFGKKEEAAPSTTSDTLWTVLKYGGIAGIAILALSKMGDIGAWLKKTLGLDVTKDSEDSLIAAITAGDWNKMKNILWANIEKDPEKKEVIEAVSKASGIDKDYLVFMNDKPYEEIQEKGFFDTITGYFKNLTSLPKDGFDKAKAYFLDFNSQHEGALKLFLGKYKDDIKNMNPKPTTYYDIFITLYKDKKIDGNAHTVTYQVPDTKNNTSSVPATTTPDVINNPGQSKEDKSEQEQKAIFDANRITFEPLVSSPVLKEETAAKEALEHTQALYIPDKYISEVIGASGSAKIDTTKLVDLYNQRKQQFEKLQKICTTSPFDKEAFDDANTTVLETNHTLAGEYKDVVSKMKSRGIPGTIGINAADLARWSLAVATYEKYSRVINYKVLTPFRKTSKFFEQRKAFVELTMKIDCLQAKDPSTLTDLEKKSLQEMEEIRGDKNLRKKYAEHTARKERIETLKHPSTVETPENKLELQRLEAEERVYKKTKELKVAEKDLKANPTDPALKEKRNKVLTELADERSKTIENITNELKGKGPNAELAKEDFSKLDAFKEYTKEQLKTLDAMEASIYEEGRALHGKSKPEIIQGKTAFVEKLKNAYKKRTQLQTAAFSYFRYSLFGKPSTNLKKYMREWVQDVGIKPKGEKLLTMRGKLPIYGLTVLATAGIGYMSAGKNTSFTEIAAQVVERMSPFYGTYIDLYESWKGVDYFNPDQKIDKNGRYMSLGFGVIGAVSDVMTVIPIVSGVGLLGRAGLAVGRGAEAAKAAFKFKKMSKEIKLLDSVKNGTEYLHHLKSGATWTVGTGSVMLTLASLMGVNIIPEKTGEVDVTPQMKEVMGSDMQDVGTGE